MRAATLLLACLLAGLAAPPAGGDWLVMRDGTRVETRGAWAERGRVVVFTSADGRLVSLRAESVDLAASRRTTAAASEAAARPAAEAAVASATPPRTSRRITNADIPTGRPAPAETPAAGEDGEAAAAAAGAADLQVRDTAQQVDPIDGHLVVTGTLANLSQRTAAAVELNVEAHGADGALLGSQSADLGLAALRPGAATGFEAHFPDVYGGAMALRFAPSASFLETQPQDGSRTSSGEGDEGFDDFADEP
jgi:hypothetical protein